MKKINPAERLAMKLSKHSQKFDKLRAKIVNDVNEFIKKNPEVTTYTLYQYKDVESFVDTLCLSGAWIQDRIDGKSGVPGLENYRGSLTKKIRKALGYTL